MNRITQGYLQNLVNQIGEKADMATSREEAEKEGKKHFLFLDFSSLNGGYRLVKINLDNGGHGGVFGFKSSEARQPAKEMERFLTGLLSGLIFPKG